MISALISDRRSPRWSPERYQATLFASGQVAEIRMSF